MHESNGTSELIARFTAYIVVVAQNARIDILRQRRGYKEHYFGDFVHWGATVSFEDAFEAEREPATDFEFDSESLQTAFGSLRSVPQDVLRYSFIHGLSDKEIAVLVGHNEKYVKKIRYRALERLRELIRRGEIEL